MNKNDNAQGNIFLADVSNGQNGNDFAQQMGLLMLLIVSSMLWTDESINHT